MSKLRRYFITGLIVLLPILLTVYIMVGIFKFADNLIGRFINPYIKDILGFYIPGLSIIIFILIIFIVGFLATYFLGKKLLSFFERIILKFPIVKGVYPAVKQIITFLFSREKLAFKKVIMVEYPRKGIWSLGFVTNEAMTEAREKTRRELLNVFIPSSPGPFTGYLLLVPKRDTIFLDISVEEGLKLIFSGGIIQP